MKINKKMKLGDVLVKYPETFEVFLNNGMHCFGCHIAQFETIEDGAKAHGINEKDLDKLIADLNNAVKNKKEKK